MPTIKDQLSERTCLQHRLAIWEAIHHVLTERFLSKDGRRASDGIRVPNCLIELVPEETIEDVLQNIADGPITELSKLLRELEEQEVIIFTDTKKVQA